MMAILEKLDELFPAHAGVILNQLVIDVPKDCFSPHTRG